MSMRHWSFYDEATGMLVDGQFSSTDDRQLSANTPPGCKAIEGRHDHLCKSIDLKTGGIVDYQPPTPSINHEWNAETKRWVLNAATLTHQQALRAAQARIAELATPERLLMRRLLLDPSDAETRRALTAIDDELAHLSKLLVQSAAGGSES